MFKYFPFTVAVAYVSQYDTLSCQSSAVPLCKSPSAHHAKTTSHQLRSWRFFFCCRSDSLELAGRPSPWSVAQRRYF